MGTEISDERQSIGPPRDVISSLLSFYGSQLTSHASMVIGFVVALFTLIQAQSSLSAPRWIFEFVAFTLVSGLVYSILRIVLYGALSSVMMNAAMETYSEFANSKEQRGLSEYGIVNRFVGKQIQDTKRLTGLFSDRFLSYRSKPKTIAARYAIQPSLIVTFWAAILLTTILFGAPMEWVDLTILMVALVIAIDVYSVFVDKPP